MISSVRKGIEQASGLKSSLIRTLEFLNGGVEMVVASPKGGQMPIDPRTIPDEQQKLEWAPAIEAAANTLLLSSVDSADFDAIFFPGGHGPMFDLPDDTVLHRLVREFHDAGKVISAVCHGPAGIVNVRGSDGEYLVKGVTLTSYTYPEEVAAKLDPSSSNTSSANTEPTSSNARCVPITSSAMGSSSQDRIPGPVNRSQSL